MGLRIGTNTQALAAQRAMGISLQAQRSSLEKVSSGSRIVRAADDAAGLAIAEKMRAHLRSIRQDVRNANDAISVVQTTEGGMAEIGSILVRFRELAIQASSDTIGDVERGFINKEVEQLRGEIDRISEITEFNGRVKLMNGKGGILEIQVGLGNNAEIDRYQIDQSKTDVTLNALGLDGLQIADKESAQQSLGRLDTAINRIGEGRAHLGAIQNRLGSCINTMQVYEENLAGARSRIFDVDMASESSELVKTNILSQAGASVLVQANQNTSLAMKLLST